MSDSTQVHINARHSLKSSPHVTLRVQEGLHEIAQRYREASQGVAAPEHNRRLAAGIDRLAAVVGSADFEDPRLLALAQSGQVTSEPGQWNPGPEQRRVLSGIGRTVIGAERASAHDVEALFTELACVGVEDVQAILGVRLKIVEAERDRLRAEVEALKPRANRTEEAELRLRETTEQHEVNIAALARQARLDVLPPARDPISIDDPETLPPGVRRHGRGYQAHRKIAGKQHQKTFDTIDEAVQWRDGLTEAVAA